MKKRIILATWLTGLAITSCQTDFLEIYPETALSSATFFTREADFLQAVNAAYVPLRGIANERSWLLGEQHSDNTYYARNTLFGAVDNTQNIADFAVPSAQGITTNTVVRDQYRLDYQIIARTNQILTTIDGVDFSADSKNNLKGQALFLRAYAYYELVRYFGKVPLHLTPVTVRQEAALPLASVEEVYAQIIKDASEAATLLLPKSKQEPGRATSGAAKMLLADVYVFRKNWAEAEKLLKEIVTSGEYSLMPDYNNAFSNTSSNKNNQESVFEIQFLEGSAGLNGNFMYRFLPRPMLAAELAPISGTSNPQLLSEEGNNIPTPDIIAAYEAGDKRKEASIAYVTLSGSERANKVYPYIKKYARPHALHNNTGNNWPVYRYAEVLLFLAEALIEQNKLSEAVPYLNQVRARAGLAATTASSQADLRTAIYRERRVELAFENKRWFDLVRTGRVQEVITAYGNRVKANPQDYYFPQGAAPPSNAFTNLEIYYPLPAEESILTPHF
ncbi:RagB/SusD family nutrient uptake outer membrane protein [Rhabdobacter roseus]|uniref:Tetratricopeptide (TPR) repeat protein n=1 Tax=Rhabdobacter roseus TaxID=1655419 RepID=A0A840TFI6_9BACT|nr:RagB/SusD family nutrient uptake outer membrane protein [Rhabdobacter roseus]MBB5282886.1 tetratricopeptide (TPR) repeat protein [Rhabdobacter roseus]